MQVQHHDRARRPIPSDPPLTSDYFRAKYLVSGNLWGVGALFFGLWLIPMGSCVLRSG
jgi:hypothetical protein